MARPETIADVKDRFIRMGSIEFGKISMTPELLKPYTAFLEAVKKMGGHMEENYSGIEMFLPRTKKQLEDQLRSERYSWDNNEKYYKKALKADESDPVEEWRRDGIREWATEEGLPNPFDVFAANDPELARIRAELGIEESEESEI